MTQDLIERLEKAEAGSEELNYLIDQTFSEYQNLGGGWERHKVTGERRRNTGRVTPACTTSLDAALALVERVLPALEAADHEKSEVRFQYGDFGCNAWLDRNTFGGDHVFMGSSKTPALALCAALLRAHREGEGQ